MKITLHRIVATSTEIIVIDESSSCTDDGEAETEAVSHQNEQIREAFLPIKEGVHMIGTNSNESIIEQEASIRMRTTSKHKSGRKRAHTSAAKDHSVEVAKRPNRNKIRRLNLTLQNSKSKERSLHRSRNVVILEENKMVRRSRKRSSIDRNDDGLSIISNVPSSYTQKNVEIVRVLSDTARVKKRMSRNFQSSGDQESGSRSLSWYMNPSELLSFEELQAQERELSRFKIRRRSRAPNLQARTISSRTTPEAPNSLEPNNYVSACDLGLEDRSVSHVAIDDNFEEVECSFPAIPHGTAWRKLRFSAAPRNLLLKEAETHMVPFQVDLNHSLTSYDVSGIISYKCKLGVKRALKLIQDDIITQVLVVREHTKDPLQHEPESDECNRKAKAQKWILESTRPSQSYSRSCKFASKDK